MTDEVLSFIDGRAGRLRLNRPKAIHALNLPMVEAMTAQLQAWASDPAVDVVLVDHAEGRGFCAGGDVLMIRDSAMDDGAAGRAFFHDEYRLNTLMFTYAKPIVAFMDGITMGGGVGISQPARFRIATENTRFAMPESGIGLFPDVGGGWYLSRLPGRVGVYLALTGARIDGADCRALGLATHYIPSEALEQVKAQIAQTPDDLSAILGEASVAPPASRIMESRADIARIFAADRLEHIFAALEADGGPWASEQLGTLRTKSPLTCKVALRQLALSRGCATFADNMAMEYRIASRIIRQPDFPEGVRALLIDKDNAPRWSPATAEGVTDAQLDAIFAPLPPDEEWRPL
ncbi:enoyl-CoA hydratase/isomerase family protein [Sphingobium subterraneum]|uniref:3-hydroxyisobutyryl-CoA hydrolase n=1 Tax=Sphingobium subterraneum TaxID=627688 RepID=A0A841J7I5_9SPHN|nr:enoyl-CoA hydratase/isomerase family protein [Sphingobium subterraneum]MBB6124518.1 enoyl-CoA hydratase [Sphingobium subterraneum]